MRIPFRRRALAVLAFAAVACAPDVQAGVVRGTVHVPAVASRPAAPHPYPGRASSLPRARPMARGMVGDAVVWLEGVPGAAGAARDAERPRLAQKDQSFLPRVLPVRVGTTVEFPNLDPIYHNVFSASPVKRFDLGKYPRGHSKKVTFDKPGTVNVYCDIHSDMEAFVVVLATHAFTQPGDDGRFALPPVPPGRYRLRAWHPDLKELEREVEVPAAGDAVVELAW